LILNHYSSLTLWFYKHVGQNVLFNSEFHELGHLNELVSYCAANSVMVAIFFHFATVVIFCLFLLAFHISIFFSQRSMVQMEPKRNVILKVHYKVCEFWFIEEFNIANTDIKAEIDW
jgi:hypothetical protein